jgi:ketosteroid isomerase-like protein
MKVLIKYVMLKIITVSLFTMTIFFSCKSKEKLNEEPELVRLNNLYDSALVNNDTSVLKRLYADDFIYTNPEGKVLTKEQQITSIAVSEMNWEAGKSEDVKVKIFDGAAVMTGSFLAKGNYRGNPVTINERYTAVWIKKGDTWQMVAEQGNVIK